MRDLKRDFGPGNVQMEIQRPRSRGDRRLARELAQLAEATGVPCVATGDPHAHTPQRALLQDAFVAIGHRLTLDGSEDARRGNRHAVLRPPAETAALFADHPEAVAQTLRTAERLEFDLTRDLGYRFPDFVGSHPGETAQTALARLCAHQLGARYPNATKRAAARARLDEELALIAHHDLAGFFLLHRDILELAREVALQVRPAGSARAGCRPGGDGGRRSAPSSVTSPASPTSTRSRTGSSWGASSTVTWRRCPTSTSTSRATSASG